MHRTALHQVAHVYLEARPPQVLGAVPGLSQVLEEPAGTVPKNISLRLCACQRVAALRVPQQPGGGQGMLSRCPRAPCLLPPTPAPHSPCWHPPGPQHPVQLQRLRGADPPVPGTHTQQHRRPYLRQEQRWVLSPQPRPPPHPSPCAVPGAPGRWASAAAWWLRPQHRAPARRSRAAPGTRSACGREAGGWCGAQGMEQRSTV